MGFGVRAAALIISACAVAACEGPAAAEAALTPFERIVVDSLAGDSAAFATLPYSLREFLDVRAMLADSASDRCDVMPSSERQEIRRLRMLFPDSSGVLLYAVADDASGVLERVEYVRRIASQGQRGLIWDGDEDRTTSTWWSETRWGLSRRVERGEIPRGGPLPRALRALGRQLMLLPCTNTGDTSETRTP
jgi:hypothetical protein